MPNHANLVIRTFATADAPAVAALIATTMRRSNAADYPAERLEALIAYFTPEKLCQLATERQCLVALAAGRVVGTAAREASELLTFFVHPEAQGRGVGTRLLEGLEAGARRLGIPTLYVAASLTGAAFYERRGYHRTGDLVPGTAGPHVALTKALTDLAG